MTSWDRAQLGKNKANFTHKHLIISNFGTHFLVTCYGTLRKHNIFLEITSVSGGKTEIAMNVNLC
jgi:hypothetical protein